MLTDRRKREFALHQLDTFERADDVIPRVAGNGTPRIYVPVVGRTENEPRATSPQFEARVDDAICRICVGEDRSAIIARHGGIVVRQALADIERRKRG